MTTFLWPVDPIVSLHADPNVPSITWHGIRNVAVYTGADDIDITADMSWYGPNGGRAVLEIWADVNIGSINSPVWQEVDHHRELILWSNRESENPTHNMQGSKSEHLTIPMGSYFVQFRVRAYAEVLYGDFESERVFTMFVDHLGDMSLRYVPIGLIYCPPEQDMYQTRRHASEFGVVTRFGFTETTGSMSNSSSEVTTGGNINFGKVGVSTSGSAGWTSAEKTSIAEATTESISFNNRWETGVTADNRTVIGRRYWGPLGDIFVLLKNSAYSLNGNEYGEIVVGAPNGPQDAELIYLPAHLLLRPSGHPIAKDIQPHERREILSLDPFFVNLDPFFPPDGSDPDPDIPLELAVDPYRSPLDSITNTSAISRAVLIGLYSIGPGVDIDLTNYESISIGNNSTDSSTYYSEVGSTSGGSLGISLFSAVSLGFNSASQSSSFVQVNYENSFEAIVSTIRSATCRLVRNQNQIDAEDIEVWWDKYFSTFMFRRVRPNAPTLSGVVIGSIGTYLSNLEISIINVGVAFEKFPQHFYWADLDEGIDTVIDSLSREQILLLGRSLPSDLVSRTLTDDDGKYQFFNLDPGIYSLVAGDKFQMLNIGERTKTVTANIKKVRRIINLRRLRESELRDILGWTNKRIEDFRRAVKAEQLNKRHVSHLLQEFQLIEKRIQESVIFEYNPVVKMNSYDIEGWIKSPSNQPQAFMPISLVPANERDIDETQKNITDSQGYFQFVNLRPGKWKLHGGDAERLITVSKKSYTQGTRKSLVIKNVRRLIEYDESNLDSIARVFADQPIDAIRIHRKLTASYRKGKKDFFVAIREYLSGTRGSKISGDIIVNEK